MSIQIANIIIWQKNGKLRNLEFKKNAVNVITGDSGKGKSSILHIVDYCLLATNADGISKSNIDNKADWYGLRLHTSKGVITIARPAYRKNEKSLCYFNDSGYIPDLPELNIKIDSLKKILNIEFGIDDELKIPFGGKTISAGSKVTFRNFLSYCYQDQAALVAPDYLYNRPTNLKVQERIERTFKMAVGIVDLKGSLIEGKIKNLQTNLDSLERKSKLLNSKSLEFEEEVLSLENEALSLGLLAKRNCNIESSLVSLNEIVKYSDDKFSKVTENIKNLETKRFELNRKLRQLRKFNEDYNKYQSLLKENIESIKPVEYLYEKYEELLPGTKTLEVINELNEELKLVQKSWVNKKESALFVDVKAQEKTIKKEIKNLDLEITRIKDISSNLSSPEEIYRYQGRLSVKVELFSGKIGKTNYSDEISEIKEEIQQLSVQNEEFNSKREFVISKLNNKINDYLKRLKLKGYESCEAVFVEKDKVINLIVDDGKHVEKMLDIGSASNYLYIHLAYFLALHEVGKSQNVPWLPSFLILDQMSSPYSGDTADDQKCMNDALKELNSYIDKMKDDGGFQIILMEHISPSRWIDLELKHFNLVDKELLGDYGLIID